MRILVTGANGQIGHELLRALRSADLRRLPAHDVIAATRSGQLEDGTPCAAIDLSDLAALRNALDRIAPDLILNAAAYTAVDRAEDEPALAQRVNGEAVGAIGAWAVQHNARVVHYSTDYVFDGRATKPYVETDPAQPVSVYGRTKLAGEIALRASGARHLILRTAWVYAARGKNFLRTMLRLAAERDEVRVVDDQMGAPTPAGLIADVTVTVLAQWLRDVDAARDGVYHLVASGQTSWCGFAQAIFARAATPLTPPSPAKGDANATLPGAKEVADYPPTPPEGGRALREGMPSHVPRIIAVTTADYPTTASRPARSVLDTSKLRQTFKVELPGWQAALDGVMAELETQSRQP